MSRTAGDGAGVGDTGGADWRPSASFETLRRRAALAAAVRRFFADRGVLEVETPLLAAATTPETHLVSFEARDPAAGQGGESGAPPCYLQTSPELHMKRLLAAGSGPIYQLSRVARGGERGRLHNPEFTLLEWYRPGWDHHRLMDEVEALVRECLSLSPSPVASDPDAAPAPRLTYRQLFQEHAGVDPAVGPTAAGVAGLDAAIRAAGISAPELPADDRDARLSLLLTHVVEPRLPAGLLFVHAFPPSQASLARLGRDADGREVAERFELYLDGVELANGFHELTDAAEQRRRFAAELAERRRRGLPEVPMAERFLAALEAGLPTSSGVALGFDRLVMRAVGAQHIDDVLAFPGDRA